MYLTQSKNDIVCDIYGCNNIARYFIRKKESCSELDSVKLCPECAKKLLKVLSNALKRGKENEQ